MVALGKKTDRVDRADAGRQDLQKRILALVSQVPDPELPMVTIADLGILRGVWEEGGKLVVGITPSYTACPATEVIMQDVALCLSEAGLAGENVEVRRVLSPAWTTDWISAAGRDKLKAHGIVPPDKRSDNDDSAMPFRIRHVLCPHCQSEHTEQVSAFGSTPCKSLYKCHDCGDPFEVFKCH